MAQEPRSARTPTKATLENRLICAGIAVRSWDPGDAKTRRSRSKSGSGRWSQWDEIGWVHYPEIGWSHSDEIRWVQSHEILQSADPTKIAAVTRQAETYSIARDDSSMLRTTLESLVSRSDVSSLIWERLALLYGQIDKKKQLSCLVQAQLSGHDIGESDRLRKEILALSGEVAESGSVL